MKEGCQVTDDLERAYMAGKRMALLAIIRQAFHELGDDVVFDADRRLAALLSEREEAKLVLRGLYEGLGWECDWEGWVDDMHLADIMKRVVSDVRDALEDA